MNDIDKTLTQDMLNKKIKEEVLKKLNEYDKTMSMMSHDIPISALCLPKAIENALFKDGRLRVYDLLNVDLVKIKGIGKVRGERLASCLDELFPMF